MKRKLASTLEPTSRTVLGDDSNRSARDISGKKGNLNSNVVCLKNHGS